MVDGHNLVICCHQLGVEGANDGLLHDLGELLASQLDGLLVDRLAVGLTDLKHEGPVWAALVLAARDILAVTLKDACTVNLRRSWLQCDCTYRDFASCSTQHA